MWARLTGRVPSALSPAVSVEDSLGPTREQQATIRFLDDRPNRRVEFNLRYPTAYGKPSTGGLIVKNLSLVDLLALGVSRTSHVLRPENATSEEEDEWCAKMYPLGVAWFKDLQHYQESSGTRRTKTRLEQQEVFVGWPSSGKGVWVLTLPRGRRQIPDFGFYDMCIDMDERCSVLERFGARFYDQPADCEEITSAIVDRYKREREELEKDFFSENKADSYYQS